MKLEDWRDEIDRIDAEIVKLINQRINIVKKIGVLKAKASLPITDITREEEILRKICTRNTNESTDHNLVNIYQAILKESREIQIYSATRAAGKGVKIY